MANKRKSGYLLPILVWVEVDGDNVKDTIAKSQAVDRAIETKDIAGLIEAGGRVLEVRQKFTTKTFDDGVPAAGPDGAGKAPEMDDRGPPLPSDGQVDETPAAEPEPDPAPETEVTEATQRRRSRAA